MFKEKIFLESEICELKKLLSQIPAENIIDRLSYENRLKKAEKELLTLQKKHLPESLIITFSGDPVRDRHGIMANFAAEATSKLSDIYATLVAVAKGSALGSAGAIPEFEKHQLLITGTAVGSFGFEMELPREEHAVNPTKQLSLLRTDPPTEDPLIKARDLLEDILEVPFSGSDVQFADVLQNMDKRAVDKVREFYDILYSKKAFYTLKTRHKVVRCQKIKEIEQAVDRLKEENILDQEKDFDGYFSGFLPSKREFEFITISGEVLRGRVDKIVKNADCINKHLGETLTIHVVLQHTKKQTRFTLYTLPQSIIEDDNGSQSFSPQDR